jgi:hypothetical protein
VNDAERFRLLGSYKTPRFRYGRQVFCELRGWVTIVGLREGPIPWPVGKRGKVATLILYGDLERALRREAAVAVAHWWGVTAQTVTKWRQALGIEGTTPGTIRLQRAYAAEPWAQRARRKAWAKARDPRRREKIAAAKRGKPRPAHVGEAVRRALKGRKLSEATRRKMSEAHRRRGTRPPAAGRPWTAEEDRLLPRLPPPDVAERTGRSLSAVYSRRRELCLPDARAGRKVPDRQKA